MQVYRELLQACPIFAETCLKLWGPVGAREDAPSSKNVWFFDRELFRRTGGRGRGTPFHQDTSYFPFEGEHLCAFWISFEATPKKNSLEIIRGSQSGGGSAIA